MSSKTEATYAAGDVVALKSGGPAVTVLSHEGDAVKVIFFSDEIGEFREATLPLVAVEAIDPEDLKDASNEEDDEEEEEGNGDGEDEEDEDQPGSGKR
jgi:uncharacterized protein YodC (DUF2158 family)